jgi:hypothetical protein
MSKTLLIETFASRHDETPQTSDRLDLSASDEVLAGHLVALIRDMVHCEENSVEHLLVMSLAEAKPVVVETPPPVPAHASFEAMPVAERNPIIIATQKASSALGQIRGSAPTPEQAAVKLPKGARVVFWDFFDSVHTFGHVPPLGILDILDDSTTVGDVALCMRAVQDVAAQKAGRLVGKRTTAAFKPMEEPEDVMWLHGMDPGDVRTTKGALMQCIEVTSYNAYSHFGTINLQLIGELWQDPRKNRRKAAAAHTARQSLSDLASLTQPRQDA